MCENLELEVHFNESNEDEVKNKNSMFSTSQDTGICKTKKHECDQDDSVPHIEESNGLTKSEDDQKITSQLNR